jgi:acetyltransferase-like isoleucine patch superfamily enzyme
MFFAFMRMIRSRTRVLVTVLRITARFPRATIMHPIHVKIDDLRGLVIGDGVHIGPFSEISVAVSSRHSTVVGRLVIGAHVCIGAHANIRATGGTIEIGEGSIVAQGVSLIASNHAIPRDMCIRDAGWSAEKTGVTIGRDVWIGCQATILPGVIIGEGAVIGAGSVVTRDIPAYEVWCGVPARKTKDRA